MDKPVTFGSLFAGIGGLDLGLERAGMECKWQVEIDEYATRVLEKHWPNVRRWKDITTFPPDAECKSLRDKATKNIQQVGKESEWKELGGSGRGWGVDLICGGFPCQDISYAGRGAGLEGERSGLFFEALRVVRQLRPRYVLLENVAALLTRGLDRVLGELGQIGYDAEWHCIPAAAVGAPHIRDRVFVIAYANGPRLAIRKGEDTRGARPICRTKPSRSEWWAIEPAVCRVANGVPRRVDRLRCLGNAVVPQVAEYIGKMIVDG